MALKDEYLTVSQVAKEFGVTRQTVSRWIANGYVDVERIGRVALIPKRDVVVYRNWRLREAASDSMIALYEATVSDILKDSGRLEPGEHVRIVDGNSVEAGDVTIRLSEDDKTVIDKHMRPILEDILGELYTRMKSVIPKKKKPAKQRRKKPGE